MLKNIKFDNDTDNLFDNNILGISENKLDSNKKIYIKRYIENKINKISSVIGDQLSFFEIYNIHKYTEILKRTLNKKKSSCNVALTYLKYSELLHLLVSFTDEKITAITERSMFDTFPISYIFTRCFASVNIFNYIFGGDTNHKNNYITSSNLKNMIGKLINIPIYYLIISIGGYQNNNNTTKFSNFGHTFVIIKHMNDLGQDVYTLLQSYYFKYCPKIQSYSLNKILIMIDELSSIYDSNIKTWTKEDNEIWKKYFLTDESYYIGTNTYKNNTIKYNGKYGYFRYYYKEIDIKQCYSKIKELIDKSESIINVNIKKSIESILSMYNILNYDIIAIINSIKNDTFMEVPDGKDINGSLIKIVNKDLEKIIYENKVLRIKSWHDLNITSKINYDNSILKKYPVKNYHEFKYYLKLLTQFFDLKKEIEYEMSCHGFLCYISTNKQNGGDIKYDKKYIKYKQKYLLEKEKFNK